MKIRLGLVLVCALAFPPLGLQQIVGSRWRWHRSRSERQEAKIVYITNGVDPFWNVAAAGTKAAAKGIQRRL